MYSIEDEVIFQTDTSLSTLHLNKKPKKTKFNEHTMSGKSDTNTLNQENIDAYETRGYKNVTIKSKKGRTATKAILTGHGGYTPRRYGILPGSGNVELPENLSIHFFSDHGKSSLRKNVQNFLDGEFKPNKPIKGKLKITNYSLTNDSYTDEILPTDDYDIINISGKSKSHFSDVIKSINKTNHNYTDIYYTCCRVNKLKAIEISPPSNLPITHL